MMQNGSTQTTNKVPMNAQPVVRMSIPLTEQTHKVFQRISNASGVSMGKCMASWLQDTLEAAEYMACKMENARQSPRLVAHELHTYAAGLEMALDSVISTAKGPKPGLTPPSSNTGGKVSPKRKGGAS